MADIFIAYSQRDRLKAGWVANALKSEGFSVWWDIELLGGQRFADIIIRELDAAKAVMVLWSPEASQSVWVREEASRAADQNKLIPTIIEGDVSQIPLGFRQYQTVDLTRWTGNKNDLDWLKVLVALRYRDHDKNKPDTAGSLLPEKEFKGFVLRPGAKKHKLFIAHASYDKPRISPIIAALMDCGFNIWIDKPNLLDLPHDYISRISRIRMGEAWRESIEKAVEQATLVLGFWSRDAIDAKRQQFHYEVFQGLIGRKLVQCKIDQIEEGEIGMPWTFEQIADLSKYKNAAYSYELNYLVDDMAARRIVRTWF